MRIFWMRWQGSWRYYPAGQLLRLFRSRHPQLLSRESERLVHERLLADAWHHLISEAQRSPIYSYSWEVVTEIDAVTCLVNR